MREHGIKRIYTRDTDFHRFPFLEPVDPADVRPDQGFPPPKRTTRRVPKRLS